MLYDHRIICYMLYDHPIIWNTASKECVKEIILHFWSQVFINLHVTVVKYAETNTQLNIECHSEWKRTREFPAYYGHVPAYYNSSTYFPSQYTLEPSERIKLEFLQNDHLGVRQIGTGLIAFNSVTKDTMCMDNVGSLSPGATYLVTTPEKRSKRLYSLRFGYMPW